MVVFTPKSMLKRKEAASQPGDFTEGTFRPFIGDDADPETVDTLLICSGRVTWDLMVERAKREDAGRSAIARVEQLYPAPVEDIKAELALVLRHLRRCAGCRTSRATWALFFGHICTSGPSSTSPRVRSSPGPAPRRRRSAPPSDTSRSRRSWSLGRPTPSPTAPSRTTDRRPGMYFTDRGIEELQQQRRGDEEVTLAWLGERLQEFTDTHPEFETAVERFATWLARLDDPKDPGASRSGQGGWPRIWATGSGTPTTFSAASTRSPRRGPAPGRLLQGSAPCSTTWSAESRGAGRARPSSSQDCPCSTSSRPDAGRVRHGVHP